MIVSLIVSDTGESDDFIADMVLPTDFGHLMLTFHVVSFRTLCDAASNVYVSKTHKCRVIKLLILDNKQRYDRSRFVADMTQLTTQEQCVASCLLTAAVGGFSTVE